MHGGGAHLDGTASLRRANLSVSLYSKAVFHIKWPLNKMQEYYKSWILYSGHKIPLRKDNIHGVLFKAQNIILLWCLPCGKSGFIQREPEIPRAAFGLLQYMIMGVQVILSSLLPDRFEVKGSGNCAYLESKGVSASGCYLTRKWVCSLNINSAQ